ncbi:ABC transporter substrate-binding protein [Brevibacterium album]|uniref:ABC transporter substrate-binding protein n=1 Tax=Brevibacterium album TaxID=417948 RepID=UPI0004155233|nr:ABC transporter substrate-binding protein [Brevibacterium album]
MRGSGAGCRGGLGRGLRGILAAATALVLAGCGAAAVPDDPDPQPQSGGTLTVGVEASWVSLDPLRATTYVSYSVLLTMYEQLFDLTAEGEVVPNLATGYEVSEDGLTYTVALREDVEFQDGEPFDADAVVTNVDRMRDPANGCSCLGEMGMLEDVRAKDPHTVEFLLNRPHAGFPTAVLASAPGMMASPAAIEASGGDLGANPVGTGPFQLVSEVADSSVRMEAWEGYRDPERPYLDGVEFRVIADTDSRYSSLASTSIDVADNVAHSWVSDAELDPSIRLDPQGAVGSSFVMFNTAEGRPLADSDARRAACMALDTELMDEVFYGGTRLTGQESPFPTGSAWDMGQVEGYPRFDQEGARSLVDELGGLSFDLQISANPENTRTAQAIEAQWRTVGIDARIRPTDQPTLVENAFAHDFDALLYRWRGAMDPDGNVNRWFNSALATPDAPSSNYNLVSDEELDGLMLAAAAERDPQARMEKYREVSLKLAEITPYCYLWGADWMRMSLVNVHGIPARPDNIMLLRDAYKVE